MEFEHDVLPLKVAMQIETVCSSYESAWQAKQPPRLEDSLQQVEKVFRPALLFELLLLEFHYQQTGSEILEIQDYHDRFPQQTELIHRAWAKCFGPIEPAANASSDAHPSQAIQAKYSKQSLHRQGGIGRVWIAHDNNLNRQVALKDLQPQYTEDPAVRERFVREAQITGKLDHPNIVPVYQLRQGSDVADPFYTMRLVEGKTLREVILCQQEARESEGRSRRDQVNLLNILTTVCQTVAYAHSQGVVHRDLKPDNIVVGDYGEIFVLDWGLAKVIDEPTVMADETVIAPVTTSTETNRAGKTLAGTRIGTPAYMAPEQAAGATDQIGLPTDVYGLGTILFEILTGQPPHQATDTDQLIQQIQQGPTPAARTLNASAAPALEAICCKAMSKNPSQRYASALDLRNEIQSWIADEPVECYRDSWWDRCSRWTRRHRRLINTAALLMLLATTGLGIGNRLLNRAHQRTQQEKESAETDFHRARSVIEGLSLEINSPQAQRLTGFKPLQRQLTQQLLDFYLYFLEQHRSEPAYRAEIADVHYQLGILANSLETLDSARLHYENSLTLFLQLSKEEPKHKPYQRQLSKCYNSLGNLSQGSGDFATAEKNYLQASQVAKTLVAGQSSSDSDRQLQLTILNNLATLYMIRGHTSEAIIGFQKILAAPQQGQPAAPTTALAAHLNLSVLYRNAGNLSESSSSLETAKKILDQLRKEQFNPEFLHEQQLTWYISQINLKISLGQWEAAQATSAAGIRAAQALIESHPGELKYQVSLAQLQLNATAIWIKLADAEQASYAAKQSLLILERLRKTDPENLQYRLDLTRGLHNLAQAERQLNHQETALRTIQLAIQEKQQLVDQYPQDKYLDLLLSSRILYADLIRDSKQYEVAEKEYRELQAIADKLAKRNQDQFSFQHRLATTTHSLAQMEKANQRWEQAQEHYQQALDLQQQLSRQSPGHTKLILELSITQYNFGNLHQAQTKLEPALALYQDALGTFLRLSKAQQKQTDAQRHLLNSQWALAETNHALKRFAIALKHWDEAIKLTGDDKFLKFLATQRQKTASQLPKKD